MIQFGDYRVHVVPDAEFRLDGGAMFGVVPRALWSIVAPPDADNRIRLNMNCLLIEADGEKILIDTGIGDKWSAKHRGMYGIERRHTLGDSLESIAGVKPEQITMVVNTHLHFDHAGGNTRLTAGGEAVPTFPNARYLVSRAEHKHAECPSERDQASYFSENWRPLQATGQLDLQEANYELAPGVCMETYAGHNRSMQCLRLEQDGRVLFGFADLIPTRAHVRLPWIMGYDLFPVETLEAKKNLLPQAVREGWMCLFYHDPDVPLGYIVEDSGKLKVQAV
ncbi:MAG: hypothetical protein QOD75_3439 [Blastocatellia bacterium]|jgi:glyoxylase-like metal-dependent hydrolase (beta-lactamase superfamily II)|nr:hypothetical protein [Blastocatellia bacterium]